MIQQLNEMKRIIAMFNQLYFQCYSFKCTFLLHWKFSKCALWTTFYTLKWWDEWLNGSSKGTWTTGIKTKQKKMIIEKHTEQMRKNIVDRKPSKMASHLINSIRFVLIRFSGCPFTCHCLPVSLLVCSFIHYFQTFQWLTYVFYLPAPCIITSWFMHIIPFVYSFDGSPSLYIFSTFLSHFYFSCTTDALLYPKIIMGNLVFRRNARPDFHFVCIIIIKLEIL